MNDSPDYYFRELHPRLVWNTAEVKVREVNGQWQFATSYGFSQSGAGGPFRGGYPTRDDAGRVGCRCLRNELVSFADGDKPTADQCAALKIAERLWEIICPITPAPNPQLQFSFA